jgi:hypothetical protein
MDLFVITLADGIPIAGDGDVKTINALMEDGALATIGRLSDAAVMSTDATPVSVISLLKQLSSTMQDIRGDLPSSLGTGGGLKIEGSGTPLPVTGTLTTVENQGAVAVTTFTCGTSPYGAGEVVGVGGGNAALFFAAIATGAAAIEIRSAELMIARSAVISGETTYRLHLYNVTPPSALADSVAFDLAAGDRSAYLGYIDFGTLQVLGSTLFSEVLNVGKMMKTASAGIYGYLQTIGAFTPTAAQYRITLGARQQ